MDDGVPFRNKTHVVWTASATHRYSLFVQDVVHPDSVGQATDLNQIVLGQPQQVGAAKVRKGAYVAGQPVVVDPLRQVLRGRVL